MKIITRVMDKKHINTNNAYVSCMSKENRNELEEYHRRLRQDRIREAFDGKHKRDYDQRRLDTW